MNARIIWLLLGTIAAVMNLALLLVMTRPAQAGGVVTTCNEPSLRAALAGGGTVTFNCSGTANILLSSQIVITSDTTIDGSNNGGSQVLVFGNTRLFSVTNNIHLTLDNLTLANGVANDNGGCIYTNGALALNNVELSQCQATLSGGALFVNRGGNADLSNSRVQNNTAGHYGGGIYSLDALTLTNSYLAYNSVSITNSEGGGLFAFGPTRIDGSTFYSNTALAVYGYGGGISSADTFSMTNSTLDANVAYYGGGGMFNGGTAAIDHVTVSGNSVTNGRGGGVINYGSLTLDNVTVRGNRTFNGDGGAVDAEYGVVNITHSRFISNETTSPYSGGAILSFSPLNISDSEFAYNQAGNGGALFPRFASAVTVIANSSFHDNITTNGTNGWGGAMLLWDGASVTLTQSSVSANTALSGGGGIYVQGASSRLTIEDSQITGNTMDWGLSAGGGIYNEGILALTGATVSNNMIKYFGGGLVNGGVATVDNSDITGNTADTAGGIYSTGIMTLNNSTISGNMAANLFGGGLVNFGTMLMNNSTISGNRVPHSNGGGFYNNGKVRLNNSTITANNAITGGGFYNANLGIATLYNVTLANNSATVGGALYMDGGHQTVLTNTILAYSPAGGNCFGTITTSKFTFSSDNSCALPAGNTIKGLNPNGLDPLLTALGNYGGLTQVHMIKLDSPARGGVVGNDAPLTDQRGLPRPGPDGSYDIGAVERQPNDTDLAPRLYLPVVLR